MRATSPVIPGQTLAEVVIAKDQPEYNNLPSIRTPDGLVLTRWTMSWRERWRALLTGNIYLTIMTFNQPLQPVRLQVEKPLLDD